MGKLTRDEKLYCVHNLISMVVENLHSLYPNLSEDEIMIKFTQSKTHGALLDLDTGLWKEGPDYIIGLLLKNR